MAASPSGESEETTSAGRKHPRSMCTTTAWAALWTASLSVLRPEAEGIGDVVEATGKRPRGEQTGSETLFVAFRK
jgi:hypothetical protein